MTDAATLEERMDDVRAVMDALGSERAALFGYSEGGAMCALFAATYPERTAALIMAGSFARRCSTEGYPFAPSDKEMRTSIEAMLTHWGGPVGLDTRAPSVAHEPAVQQWFAKFLRMSASRAAAGALARANLEVDIRHLLPSIRTPTLILHSTGDAHSWSDPLVLLGTAIRFTLFTLIVTMMWMRAAGLCTPSTLVGDLLNLH
jgi:pimeloyl-ACP methyl ester carboxylesterase